MTNWDDFEKLWASFEITLTEGVEEKELKVAEFKFKSWDDLRWAMKTFAKFPDDSYVEYSLKRLDNYINGVYDEGLSKGDKKEQREHWKEMDKDGVEHTFQNRTVTVFPKTATIFYSGWSFHHFFQHMFDWIPRELDNALLNMENRRIPIATFKDGDLEIPVSRGMISAGFMISSQKVIDDEWDNSIKKWLVRLHEDDRYKAIPKEEDEE